MVFLPETDPGETSAVAKFALPANEFILYIAGLDGKGYDAITGISKVFSPEISVLAAGVIINSPVLPEFEYQQPLGVDNQDYLRGVSAIIDWMVVGSGPQFREIFSSIPAPLQLEYLVTAARRETMRQELIVTFQSLQSYYSEEDFGLNTDLKRWAITDYYEWDRNYEAYKIMISDDAIPALLEIEESAEAEILSRYFDQRIILLQNDFREGIDRNSEIENLTRQKGLVLSSASKDLRTQIEGDIFSYLLFNNRFIKASQERIDTLKRLHLVHPAASVAEAETQVPTISFQDINTMQQRLDSYGSDSISKGELQGLYAIILVSIFKRLSYPPIKFLYS